MRDASWLFAFRLVASWLDRSASPWLIVDQLNGDHQVGVPGTVVGSALG